MPPAVTYDGVEGAEGGTIFKDRKFWLSHRVPMRNRWTELITQNGGKVVMLEKHADMLIADHLRKKDAPPGSYSWKFIEDSVKNGYIQIKDKYLIGRHPDEPRPVGSNQAKKSTRTKFTAEDDAKLTRWALNHPDEQKGNQIWYEYERINPRHTAQSWRDHWIKKLQFLDRKKLESMAASAPAEAGPVASTSENTAEDHNTVIRVPRKAAVQRAPAQRVNNQVDAGPIRRAPQPQPTTKIELFDLMLAARDAPVSQDSQLTDWYRVAENLGFVEPDQHTVNELHLCYEENLMDFLEIMESFEVNSEDAGPESQGAAPDMDPSQDIDFEDGQERGLLQSQVPSSPPIAASSLKRTAGEPPLASPERFKKRRYSKDMEIPSTPDAEETSKLQRAQETSPGALRTSQWLGYIGESEASQHLPPLPPMQEESQDLGTRPALRQDTRHQSVDISLPDHPALDTTPIPLHLNKHRQQISSRERQRESHAQPMRRRHDSSFTEQIAPRRAVSSAKPNPKPSTRTVRRSLPASFDSSRAIPRTNQPQNPEKSNSREIQKWIARYESMGYPRQFVVEALKRTTLTPGKSALLVMKHLSEGRDVPSHHEGIWTDRDDADLDFATSVDFHRSPADDSEELQQERAQKAHNRLVNKHGFQRFNLRKAFLEAQAKEGGSHLEG
ncbi:BRCT domain [Fusarium oxysporum f. sp. vasinfectum]|nr:BRCT domain [Fusarium oxysporum f. sp. vasinfectum]